MNPGIRSGRIIQLMPSRATPEAKIHTNETHIKKRRKPRIILERETGLEPATLSLEG